MGHSLDYINKSLNINNFDAYNFKFINIFLLIIGEVK